MMIKKTLFFFSLFFLLFSLPSLSFGDHTTIKAPPGTHLIFPKPFKFPSVLEARGPLGGIFRKNISSLQELATTEIKTGIIKDKNSNPETVSVLPELCPRVTLNFTSSPEATYHGEQDSLNHIPFFQLMDPDARQRHTLPGLALSRSAVQSYTGMDGHHVLLLKKVAIDYDDEDSGIIDYEGPNPLTGKQEIVHEGEGGFYANFHYAVVPYDSQIPKMDRETLLHLSEGKLSEIDRDDLRPKLRTHSFIPGPFLSKKNPLYSMCEWGDTAHQAPHQELTYSDIALWDWDYWVKNEGHVLLIVWEGDEEEWLIKDQLIDPFYLTDDLVGVFDIWMDNTLQPLTLVNKKGDFKITVQTGDLTFPIR